MARVTPFLEDVWNLSVEANARIAGPDDQVVSGAVVNPTDLVGAQV